MLASVKQRIYANELEVSVTFAIDKQYLQE